MALPGSTTFYNGSSTWLYLTLPHTTMALLGSTWLYYTLPWFYLALLDTTTLYHGSSWLYDILPIFSLTLHNSTTFYQCSPWLYLTLLDSTTLYHGSTSLYFTLLHSTITIPSLVPRPSPAPVFDRLQYAKTEGEGLVNLTTWSAAHMTSQVLDTKTYSHLYLQLQRS